MLTRNPFFFLNLNRNEGESDDDLNPGGGGGTGGEGGGDPGGNDPAGSDPGNPVDSGGAGDEGGEGGSPWPADWRAKIANGDEKILAQLGRYESPAAIFNKARALETRLSSGELKSVTPFPAEGSDEQKAAWRSENGIPDKPDGYEIALPEGMVIGEADAPLIDSFKEFAHENNLPPDAVNVAVNWYFASEEARAEQRNQLDLEIQQTNTDILRSEYGENYRPVMNSIKNLLATAPNGVGEALMGARLADGTPLASDVGIIKALADWSHQINPVSTLMGGGTSNMQSISDEISKLENMMADRTSEYWKGTNAEKNQQRYRDLLDARSIMEKKGQAA